MYQISTVSELMMQTDNLELAFEIAANNSHEFGPIFVTNTSNNKEVMLFDGRVRNVTTVHGPTCYGHTANECTKG